MTEFFLKGLIIGFSIAIAVGPIALLCIQRTISYGFRSGISIGLGAALADGLYGLIAGVGLIGISDFLIEYEIIVSLLGSLFLLYLGISTVRSVSVAETTSIYSLSNISKGSILHSLISSFFLTLSNPMTILFFTAIFTSTSIGLMSKSLDYNVAFSLVSGILIGSTIWWIILSGVISAIRTKLSQKAIKLFNQISGILLLGFASFTLIKLMF